MRHVLNILLLCGAIQGLLLSASGQEQRAETVELTLMTEEFDALDGMSSNCIYNIEQDGLGFIWFATAKGLDRFDGSRFVNHLYSDLVQAEQSLAQVIINMYATSDTAFRVTLSQALRFPQTDTTFHFLPLTPERKAPALEPGLTRGHGSPLGHWQFTSSSREQKALFIDGKQSSPAYTEDRPFSLWEGGPNDSLLLYRSLNRKSELLFQSTNGMSTAHSDHFVDVPNAQGEADPHILGFDGEHLLFFNKKPELYPKGTLVQQSVTGGHEAIGHWNDWFPIPFNPEMHRSVIRINPWNGDIWCFLDNQLAIVTPDREVRWNGILSEHYQFASLINCIEFTDEHEVWVGSCKGLLYVRTEPDHFEALFTANVTLNDNIGGLMDGLNSCRSIQELGPDSFVFATNGHGVRLFTGKKSRMLVDEHGGGAGLYLRSDTVFFASPDGLASLDNSGSVARVFPAPLPETEWSLYPGDNGNWLLGATGVWEVDLASNQVFPHVMPAGAENAFIYQFTDIRDTLWAVGAMGIFAKKQGQAEWNAWHDIAPGAPVIQEAHHILVDSRDVQWVSTATRGLIRWDPASASLQEFGPDNGLPSSTVYGGFEDETGNLWFSTDNGLFRMTLDAQDLTVFDERHGLHETEFNRTGVHLGPSGMAYFSTIDGIVRFDPLAFGSEANAPPPLVLTSLLHHPSNSNRIDEVLVNFQETGSIILSSEDDFLSVRFSLLEFGNIPQYYRYRLDIDRNSSTDDWFPLDRPEINLSGLPPGTSTLEIQARVRGTSWDTPPLRIPITVPFPWFQDPFRVGLLLVLGAAVVYSVIRIRLRSLRWRNKMLADMVEERTQDLTEALQLKEVYLKEVHHRVKNNLQIISSLLDLQAAGEPLQETRKAIGSGRARIESISLIHKHLYLDPTSRSIHISDFIQEYVVLAEDAFIHDKTPVEWHIEGEDILLGIDEAQPFGLLLNELLTNSLQHGASASGQHSISITWRQVDEVYFQLEFSDSGPGLPQHIDLLNPQKLGLKMINRLTKQLKGQFEHVQGAGLRWKFTFSCKFQNMK